MTTAATGEFSVGEPTADAHGRARSRPYAPSWMNVLGARLERLPGPTWLAYLLGVGTIIAVSLLVAGERERVANGGLFGLVYYSALPLGALRLMHALDRTADRAIGSLRPLLNSDDVAIEQLRYRLSVAPARPAAIVSVVAFVITPIGYALDPIASGIADLSPVQLGFRYVWESLITAVFLVLILHTARQLRLIDGIHGSLQRIDVFDQGPLYGLSQLTATTGVGLVVLLAPSLFMLPPAADVTFVLITAAWYVGAVVAAAVAFVVPLRGIHSRLAVEKQGLQRDLGRRVSVSVEAMARGTSADAATLEEHHRMLSSLVTARDVVDRVPTWPWRTGALTGFLSAVLLPLVLFIVQQALSRIV